MNQVPDSFTCHRYSYVQWFISGIHMSLRARGTHPFASFCFLLHPNAKSASNPVHALSLRTKWLVFASERQFCIIQFLSFLFLLFLFFCSILFFFSFFLVVSFFPSWLVSLERTQCAVEYVLRLVIQNSHKYFLFKFGQFFFLQIQNSHNNFFSKLGWA